MSRKTFISVGECMAELQLVRDSLFSLGFGGDTLNTAWYVKALAHPQVVQVEYFTAVGSDQLSRNLLAFLQDHGIGTQFIKEISDRNVGLYLISLTGAERSFTYWRSASAAKMLANDEQYLRTSLSQADVIYFSGITLAILAPSHRRILLGVMREMKSKGITVVFDTNARRRLWPSDVEMRKAMIAGYRAATLAMPTLEDERALFGDIGAIECAKRIAGYGVEEIVVKDGANPCTILKGGELSSVAANQVEGVVDTTGAGDSFNAAYIVGRMANKSAVEAARVAHQVAGRVIRGRGALLDMTVFSDIQAK
jgi:2-dehydro-3-deoxygluconokinase